MQRNEKGMTLIEILAALLIFGMVASILYSFMLMGVSMYKRVTMETQMRNQGDGLYSQIISELKEAIYVQDEGTDKKIIRYAKKNNDPKMYIDLFEMEVIPDPKGGGKIEIRDAGTNAVKRVFQLGNKFTIREGSLSEASQNHDRVQVTLEYARVNSNQYKDADNPKLVIDSQIPLFRND
ncbi:prepilin-type N-terminal cleavage/methylation domain-containing protein [Paenibacillus qinlingensis]|uniref:Prepilin-type N-terminal cleavage/methylation domain-containing protein n=1 Tax=Paenibacillus qinlingensis TaxID=1837343 RepID=A0ABU1NRN7_9BACL|nr:prepilin-type N-terminal cleavage/methylation domain-containing protein [Paenibacillus qinlingensis]MDR6549547.1 prepilin-type N-terminal cleavage/methylation domain-containing protein [Paenibacillus qinlingensis]